MVVNNIRGRASCTHLRFEAKFSTGFGGPANIDVVLEGAHRLAIEGKFREPFESRYFQEGNAVGAP